MCSAGGASWRGWKTTAQNHGHFQKATVFSYHWKPLIAVKYIIYNQ